MQNKNFYPIWVKIDKLSTFIFIYNRTNKGGFYLCME